MTLDTLIKLANAIAPYVQPVESLAEALFAAIKAIGGASGETDAQADADLHALIADALTAKVARDAAAAGGDPQ